MRWRRGQDLVASTCSALPHGTVGDDLSCRALGLLARWLSSPPGAEIDSIPEMVNQARRKGKWRLEGLDALYAASYELELAGYMVREEAREGTGRYEPVVRVYSTPVEPSRRSDPHGPPRTGPSPAAMGSLDSGPHVL